MTIDTNLPSRSLIALSPDGAVQAMMIELGESANEADRLEHDATRDRFDAAEDALDEAARAARLAMWEGVLGGVAGVTKGVTDAMGAVRPTTSSDATPSGDSTAAAVDGAEEHGSRSLGATIAMSTADDVISLGSTAFGGAAARAKNAQARAQLVSDRAKERSDEAGERATRDRSARETLMRQLDELSRQESAARDRALAALGR